MQTWIVSKKGIPVRYASYGISKVLMDMELGKMQVKSNHGADGFDNLALRIARDQMAREAKDGITEMEKVINEQIKEIRGGYFRKVAMAIFGRL